MRKSFLVLLVSASLVGVLSASMIVIHANSDDKIVSENEAVDYEAILSPYQKVFDDFNSSHGTTYGFMTDEQLSLHNMDKEEYLKNVVDEYSDMTAEEFMAVLEEAYSHEKETCCNEVKIS